MYCANNGQYALMNSGLNDIIKSLDGQCAFGMCDGPDKPFVSMKTCRVCYSIQVAKTTLGILERIQKS